MQFGFEAHVSRAYGLYLKGGLLNQASRLPYGIALGPMKRAERCKGEVLLCTATITRASAEVTMQAAPCNRLPHLGPLAWCWRGGRRAPHNHIARMRGAHLHKFISPLHAGLLLDAGGRLWTSGASVSFAMRNQGFQWF
jgi:hypothetical protein